VVKKSLLSAFLAAVLIAGLILASALHLGTVHASTPKPSVPDFTVKLVNNWYDVPTTYSTDPYTGETVTHLGYRVDNITVELSIKNQPFDYSANGLTYHLYYNIRTKPHFVEDWTELYPLADGPNSPYDWDNESWSYSTYVSAPPESNSDFTILSLPAGYPSTAQVDFQVEAIVGHASQVWVIQHPLAPEYGGYYEPAIAYDTTSGWSNTQTLTIGEGQTPTPSPATTPTPTPTPAPTPIQVPGQSSFSVESNSTVTNLFFNSTSSELSFTVNGTSGTAGYVKVTIAKSLVSSVQNVKAYLDGSQLDVEITSDEASWLLSFTYMHSTHNVRISLAANATATTFPGSEFWIDVVVIAVVVGVCLLLYFKKRNC
jgi:hypothetical protein